MGKIVAGIATVHAFPIARAHVKVEAADLMRQARHGALRRRAALRGRDEHGELLAAAASWEAANVCLQTHGGFTAEYDAERKFRETRPYQVAPVSTNLILSYIAEHVLELPRSY